VGVFFRSLAIDNRASYDICVVWVGAADGDGLASKIDITVAVAGICARCDDDPIAVNRCIYGRLNGRILARHQPIHSR
jgi:hypothetical protein